MNKVEGTVQSGLMAGMLDVIRRHAGNNVRILDDSTILVELNTYDEGNQITVITEIKFTTAAE